MKSAIIPSVRVAPEFREQIEHVLGEAETVSSFVEAAVRNSVRQRLDQAEFAARGMRSLTKARKSGQYVEADDAIERLNTKLASARTRQARAAQ